MHAHFNTTSQVVFLALDKFSICLAHGGVLMIFSHLTKRFCCERSQCMGCVAFIFY